MGTTSDSKYANQYVATASFQSREVVSWGSDMVVVYNEAKMKGISEPVINFIHKEGTVCIY